MSLSSQQEKDVDKEKQAIIATVELYFLGTHHANVAQLEKAFHPAAHISGSLHGEIYDWDRKAFIDRVVTAAKSGDNSTYDKEIIFIDYTGEAAMVKARVVVGDYTFTDYISLLKINGHWVIRNKSFTT